MKEVEKMVRKKNKKIIFFIGFLIFVLLNGYFIKYTMSAILPNDVEVKPNTDLIYYLDVSYDGVDKMGNESSSTTISEIQSGYIYVEDKIPEGLTFNGFVTTEDGSIGAVKRSDGSACVGKVIDDTDGTETLNSYHGLHYDEETRTVSFKVKNLKAGCVLTVGIKTITPEIDDPDTTEIEKRRDFYNFAISKENALTVPSNTVHAWMGSESVKLYNVKYEYTGDVPTNAPTLPSDMKYASGNTVGVSTDILLEGYTFSGWSTTDATVTSSKFKMPEQDVVFTGSFTAAPSYKVTYQINGTTPSGYVIPSERNYYEASTVKVDNLKAGDVFNGYRFLGWSTTDINISTDNDFEMPNHDVVLIGEFEEVTYKVSYKFYDQILPPNSDSLLPEDSYYKPGETVKLEEVSDVSGYKFLGWYKEDNFTMPEEDVVIYGEWKVQNGVFEPQITKEIIGEKEYYRPGDIVKYKIVVTNTASYPINNVIVKEENENAYFVEGDGYEIASTHIVNISLIEATSSATIYAEYKVTATDKGTIKNVASIIGGLAENYYELNTEKEYKATASFKVQSQIKICKTIKESSENIFQFKVSGTDNDYETWLSIEGNECNYVYVSPGTYNVFEVIPQEFSLTNVSGAISENNKTFTIEYEKDYEISFTNEFKKKGFLHSFGRVENKINQGE